jgi:hypothetical protein
MIAGSEICRYSYTEKIRAVRWVPIYKILMYCIGCRFITTTKMNSSWNCVPIKIIEGSPKLTVAFRSVVDLDPHGTEPFRF